MATTGLSSAPATLSAGSSRTAVQRSLGRRHLQERIFRTMGIVAIVLALGFVGILFVNIVSKGAPSFSQPYLHLDVAFDPEVIDVGPPPQQQAGQSDADFHRASLDWQRQVALVNWNKIVETAVRRVVPPEFEIDSRQLRSIVENNERYVLRDRFVADTSLLGRTIAIDLVASADVDNWLKGSIDRAAPDERQPAIAGAGNACPGGPSSMRRSGVIRLWSSPGQIFSNVDSAARPLPPPGWRAPSDGLALHDADRHRVWRCRSGSSSAIYLEEFAPKIPADRSD